MVAAIQSGCCNDSARSGDNQHEIESVSAHTVMSSPGSVATTFTWTVADPRCLDAAHFRPCAWQGCRLVARTLKPLRAGEPAEHCYGPQQGQMVTSQRRHLLQAQYNFHCRWPYRQASPWQQLVISLQTVLKAT